MKSNDNIAEIAFRTRITIDQGHVFATVMGPWKKINGGTYAGDDVVFGHSVFQDGDHSVVLYTGVEEHEREYFGMISIPAGLAYDAIAPRVAAAIDADPRLRKAVLGE